IETTKAARRSHRPVAPSRGIHSMSVRSAGRMPGALLVTLLVLAWATAPGLSQPGTAGGGHAPPGDPRAGNARPQDSPRLRDSASIAPARGERGEVICRGQAPFLDTMRRMEQRDALL